MDVRVGGPGEARGERGGGGHAQGGGGDLGEGSLVCVAAVALKGICRAVCQHQVFMYARMYMCPQYVCKNVECTCVVSMYVRM